jgi:hypothetical protein
MDSMILSGGGSVILKAFTENWSRDLFLIFLLGYHQAFDGDISSQDIV